MSNVARVNQRANSIESFSPVNTFIRRTIRDTANQQIQRTEGFSFWQKFSKIALWALLFFILFGVFLYIVPRVEVIIVTEKRDIKGTIPITFDTTKTDGGIVAGKLPSFHYTKQVKTERSFQTTGTIDIGKRSTGKALFSNRTGLDWPLLSEHSVRGGGNKLYHAVSDAFIPKATVSMDGEIVPGQVEIELEADSGGESYNLDQGKILTILTVPQEKQDKIFGYVSVSITGGSSQIVRSLSREDVERSQNELLVSTQDDVLREFQASFGEAYYLSDQLLFLIHSATSTIPRVDEPATEFKTTLDAQFGGIAVQKKLIEEAISLSMKKDTQIHDGETLAPTISYDIQKIKSLNPDGFAASAEIHYQGQVTPQLPVDEIKFGILGKKEHTARLFLLSQKGVKDARFNYKWNLLLSIPNDPKKVTLIIQ